VTGLLLAVVPSVLATGASYLWFGSRLFVKRDGLLHPLSRLLFWLYLLINWASWEVLRRLPGENAYDEIAPGLYLGRRLTARDDQPDFAAVLDMTCEFTEPRRLREAPAYLCLPVLDGTAPTPKQLEQALAFIEAQEEVYVHCAMGHGRSMTVICAHLLATGAEKTIDGAESRVRKQRPKARLKQPQRHLLKRTWCGTDAR
jgi:hypothetical protein